MPRSCPVCGGVCKGNDERCAVAYRLQSLAADAHDREVEARRRDLRVVPPEDLQVVGDDIQGAAEAFMQAMESK